MQILRRLSIGFAVGLSCAAHPGLAADIPLAEKPYLYSSKQQGLADALRYFGKNVGIAIRIAGEVPRTADIPSDRSWTRRSYLDYLSDKYDLVWYFDGTTAHISPAGDVQTELVPFKEADGREVVATLVRVGIYQDKFVHRFDEKSRLLLVSGPPSYVDIVKKTAKAIEDADRVEMTVLRGRSGTPTPVVADPVVNLPETGSIDTGPSP